MNLKIEIELMSEFAVKIVQIKEPVINHPNADRLTLVKIGGYEAIANKHDDGSFRYQQGDYVVYIPEASLLPVWLLKKLDLYNESEQVGLLAGPKGNRVKAIKLRSIISQGILVGVQKEGNQYFIEVESGKFVLPDEIEGYDVADMLQITKYEPSIPVQMAGEVCAIFGKTMSYDFENLKSVPDIFEVGERVIASEKLHGTCAQFGYIPGLDHDELFGDNCVYVASKGLGSQGLVLKNNEINKNNIYVKTLVSMLDGDLFAQLQKKSEGVHSIHIFGEIYGAGIQKKYGYGLKSPDFRVFDIAIDRHYLPHDTMLEVVATFGLKTVPYLYDGPFDVTALEVYRDGLEIGAKVAGKDSLSGTNTREGIVVKAYDGGYHPIHRRKIAKMINPKYLLATDGEEFN